jgi:hypothetical protein
MRHPDAASFRTVRTLLVTTALAVAVAVPATSAAAAPKKTDGSRSATAEKLAPAKLAKITETPFSITDSEGDNQWKVAGKLKWDANGTRSDGDLVDEGPGIAMATFFITMADGTSVQKPAKDQSYQADNDETSVDWSVKGKVTKVSVWLTKHAAGDDPDDLNWKIKNYTFRY